MNNSPTQRIRSDTTMSQAMPHAHNYHAWVFSSFAGRLKRGRVLEIGSGHAAYSRMLAQKLESVIVSDIDPDAVERIRQELVGSTNVEYLVMDGVDPKVLETPVENVVLLNLLEHVEKDTALLRRCYDALARDGRLVVFSPAFPLLFSRMDREAGHYRRYTRRGLIEVVRAAGFEIETARFFNAVGFVGWYVNKLMRSGIHSSTTNAQISLYDRLIPWIRKLDALIPFAGQSLVVVARRPA